MARRRPAYSPEFSAETIRLLRTSADPVKKVARDLGVSSPRWKPAGFIRRSDTAVRSKTDQDHPRFGIRGFVDSRIRDSRIRDSGIRDPGLVISDQGFS